MSVSGRYHAGVPLTKLDWRLALKPMKLIAIAATAVTLFVEPLIAQAPTDEQIDEAIERGVRHLWSTQQDSGFFSDLDPRNIPSPPTTRAYPGDRTIMALIVLAYAGESMDKPEMQKALKALDELPVEHTYLLGFRIITYAELYRRNDDAKKRRALRTAIKRDADLLVDIQMEQGPWFYYRNTNASTWDFSNTQIAVLGLREAVACGVEVNPQTFEKVLQLYLQKQRDDGGWNYGRPGNWEQHVSYGSMTAAAVASLFICRDVLDPEQGCPCRNNRSRKRNAQVNTAIYRGVDWLGQNFSATENPGFGGARLYYWLYACERVGIHTGFKYLGTHNWYVEGATRILATQQPDGSWGTFDRTAFALLFLIKGRGPILMNKLQIGEAWDLHPRDAAHLADFVGGIKEQRFNWQVIHMGIPVEEMHDAPILYITLEEPVELTDEQKKKLRDYTDTGGTILFEASCGSKTVAQWWEGVCREVWPEWEFQHIGPNHPLWSADLDLAQGQRLPAAFRGLDDGMRTFLYYSPQDISCKWHTEAVAKDEAIFKVGNNLYAYATDRAKIRGRLAGREVGVGTKYADQKSALQGAAGALTVAALKHGGRWHVNRHYHPWQILGEDLRQSAGLELRETEPVDSGQPIAADIGLLYLAGRDLLEFNDGAVGQLKAYVSGGGFLLAEAIMGDEKFDGQFRKAMESAGLTLKPLDDSHPLITGAMSDSHGYAIARPDYTFILRSSRVGKQLPELVGIYQGDRLVGVYSPFDIMYSQTGCKAFNSRGYTADDARALATNIALFACRRRQ
ncbi:MAG: DUF4159 domain-containing protein [Planctomycetes bacterium]|nr:DUF4159 domain-containing protein [Planctomycetota bacterium]